MVDGGSFHLAHYLFHSALLYSVHFSSPVTICFKNGTFLLHFSIEVHVEICQEGFFSLNLWVLQ